MKLSLGADEPTAVVDFVLDELIHAGHNVTYYGPRSGDAQLAEENVWPMVARRVAEDVAAGRSQEGVLFCWTGTGVSMTANKVRGIRAALCVDAETARGARLWNNANVLCMSLRSTAQPVAKEILQAWYGTTYQPNPSDDASLRLLNDLEGDR
ncbi:MAG: RpiB/LacA/LacB family sugar-phosphate isomerase [Bellilinea sp.]